MARGASGGSFFCTNRCGMPPAAYFFLTCQKKVCKKRDAGERNSAYAPEKLFVSLYVLSFCFRRLNALRAAVESGFPSARYAVQIALFAPVEYLTYGSRNSRRVFRLPRQLNKNASVARLDNLKQFPHKTSPGENPRKGAAAPFLVVLRGLQRGEGSHANPAKRFVWEEEEQRNGRGLSAACRRQDEGCGVCSDATPPLLVSFSPPAAFSFDIKGKGG